MVQNTMVETYDVISVNRSMYIIIYSFILFFTNRFVLEIVISFVWSKVTVKFVYLKVLLKFTIVTSVEN